MDCSVVREALSARWDGEEVAGDHREDDREDDQIARHLAGCAQCQAFAAALPALNAATVRAASAQEATAREALSALSEANTMAARATARWQRRRESRMYILRWAVGLMGGAELANAALQLVLHGTSEAHATHESLSFAIAISLALICASVRPSLAAGYVPVVGTAAGLLLATAAYDVASGRITWYDELPHVDLLIGCVLMWVLGREQGPGPRPDARRWRPLRASAYSRLRVVPPSGGGLARLGKVGLGTVMASVVLMPGAASAHAGLESSQPAPNSVLASAPEAVTLTFNESVSVPTGGLRVFAPDGSRADQGAAQADGSRVSVAVSGENEGTYLVSYRVVSADSHPITGAFTYAVGHATAAPSAPQAADETSLRTVLGVSRFVGYVGAALLIGGVALWLLGWAPTRASQRVALGGSAAVAVAGAVNLALKGPLDAGLGWGAVGDGSLLSEVLLTTYGRAELTRVVLAILAGVVVAGRARLGRREFALIGAVFAVLISATFALVGHASAGTAPAMSVPSWTIHALAMSLWVGGLVHLVLGRLWRAPEAGPVLRRFSRLALWSVGALVVTGVFQSWRQVRSWDALFGTPYGYLLAIKVVMVLVVVVIGYGSRRLLAGAAGSSVALGRTVIWEVGGGAVVLALTAGLVAAEPAATAYRPTVATTVMLAGETVRVRAESAGAREVDLTVAVRDDAGDAREPEEVGAQLTLPAAAGRAEIGPLPVELESSAPGQRSAHIAVPVAGTWRLAVTVRVSEIDQETATVEVPIR